MSDWQEVGEREPYIIEDDSKDDQDMFFPHDRPNDPPRAMSGVASAPLTQAPGDTAVEKPTRFHQAVMCLAEFIASFYLILITCALVWASGIMTDDALKTERVLYVSLGYGFIYGSLIYALSFDALGGKGPTIRHMNPIVTMCAIVLRKTSLLKGAAYFVAQGLAVGFVCWMLPGMMPDDVDMHEYETIDDVSRTREWVCESLTSFVYLLIVLLTCFGPVSTIRQVDTADTSETSPQSPHELNSIIAGLTVFVCSAAGSAVSGGFMNPCVALTIFYLNDDWTSAAVFAPFVGALFALFFAVVFKYKVRLPKKKGMGNLNNFYHDDDDL